MKPDHVPSQRDWWFADKGSVVSCHHMHRNKGQLLCLSTWLQCAFMHGHSGKPQVTETVQLAESAELSGLSGTEGSTWNCVRPLQALCAGSTPADLSSHWRWCILHSRCSWERAVLALTWGHFLPSPGTAGCVLELGCDRMSHQMAADWHQFLRPTFLNSLLPPQGNLSIVQKGCQL